MTTYSPKVQKYLLEKYHSRRNDAIKYLGGKCIDCDSVELLEFDHVNPSTKLFSIGKRLLGDLKEIYKEIDKCVLRCQACHRKRSSLQLSVDHGEGLSGKKNCRCIPCKERKREYMKIYMRKRRAVKQ